MTDFEPDDIKDHYRSGTSILSRDFFIPCLKACHRYRRAVAYFSTNALLEWVEIVDDILDNQIKIELLLSPNLSKQDLEALKDLNKENKIKYIREYSEEYFSSLQDYLKKGKLDKWRVEFFSWLIANEILEIRFAFPEANELGALFHEKIGVFDINDSIKIAFTGSANETSGGYMRNYESIDVYRNWVEGDLKRVKTKLEQFTEAWENRAPGLIIHELNKDVLERIKSYSTHYGDKKPIKPIVNEPIIEYKRNKLSDTLWDHQKKAFNTFLIKKAGILEMATGTGKTRTAIAIMEDLLLNKKIDGAIMTVEGTDLLNQWQFGLDDWNYDSGLGFKIFGQYDGEQELGKFIRNPKESILVLSRHQLDRLFKHKEEIKKYSLLIIHDEIHGFGSPSHVNNLKGSHKLFEYKLGLSATPDREYDEEGNNFIENEVGPVIFKFDLSDAIKKGILCEFDYIPIEYEISENDKQRIQGVYAKYRKKDELGEPYHETDKFRDLAMVYKTAENKIFSFEEIIDSEPELLKSCLIFVATTAYAENCLPFIHDQTHNYSTYFSGAEEYHLEDFAAGKIDCLITCHKLSQGIDIPSVSNIVLLSSDRAKLETIQRIGRSLRIDDKNPDKRAKVYDFIGYNNGTPIGADKDRKDWLSELSKTKKVI
jgi:superfamily II DNA or RNA helicase